MSEPDPRIAELEARLDRLVRTQIGFQTEISAIRAELSSLRGPGGPVQPSSPVSGPHSDDLPERSSTKASQPVPPRAQPQSPPRHEDPYEAPRDRPPAGRDIYEDV